MGASRKVGKKTPNKLKTLISNHVLNHLNVKHGVIGQENNEVQAYE